MFLFTRARHSRGRTEPGSEQGPQQGDQMSNTDDPQEAGIKASAIAWARTMYDLSGWVWGHTGDKLGSSAESTEATADTAMQKMRARMDPRPVKTVVPPGASAQEEAAIDQLFADLLDHLDTHAGSEDLTQAKQMFVAVVNRVDQAKQDIAQRALDAKKVELSDRLKAIPFSTEVTDTEARAFAKSRSALSRVIAGATDLSKLEPVEPALAKLEKAVTAALAMVGPRQQAQDQITAARSARDAMAKVVDRGYYKAVTDAIAAADKALHAAKTASEITSLRAALKAVMDKEGDARAYAAEYESKSLKVELYLSVHAPDPDRDNRSPAHAAWIALTKSAAQKSAALDFSGARAELAKFETHSAVSGDGANVSGCGSFATAYDSFMANYDDKRLFIKGSKIRGAGAMDADLAAARKKGICDKDWAAAKTLLEDLQDKIDKLHPVAVEWRKIYPLTSSLASSDPLRQAVDAAKSKLNSDGSGDHAAAKAALTGVSGTERKRAATLARLAAVKKRVEGIDTSAFSAAHSHANGLVSGVEGDIPGDLDAANTGLDALEPKLDAIEAWMPLMTDARAARAMQDASDAYGFLDDAIAEAGKNDYAKARTKAAAALTNYQLLARYQPLRAQVTGVRDCQTSGTPPHVMVDAALTEAHDLATVQKDLAKAITRLQQVLADPALAELAHEIGLWQQQYPRAKKQHDKITTGMEPAAAKKTLTDAMAAVEDKANTDHDYPGAMELLETHRQALVAGRAYVANRKRAKSLKKALDRAVATFSGVPDVEQKLYGHTDDSKLRAAMKAADDLAIAGKVADAAKAYAALLTSWQGFAKETAKLHEAADAVGSNAGHSIDRHGADVTDAELLARLTTGVAPDGKTSTTRASSKFDTFEAWLQAREEGAAMLEQKSHPGSSDTIKVSDTSVPADVNAVVAMKAEIDHQGPIDKAYVGVKPAPGVDPVKGKIGKGDTYETYEALDGITRSQTLWLFEIDFSGLTIPPVGHVSPPDFRHKGDPKAYIDIYTNEHGAAPASIPGKWVMMQLFPLVDKWNQELQDYET